MSTFEDDLRLALKTQLETGELRDVGNAAAVFTLLSRSFQTLGSKIDWRRVPGSVESFEQDASRQKQRFMRFFDEIRSNFHLAGSVVYVGDSATDFALEGSVDAIRQALPALIAVPQHHYFVGPDSSWCMCLTMEGDMGFGYSEKAPHH